MSEVIVMGLNLLQLENIKFEVHFLGNPLTITILNSLKTHGILSPIELSNFIELH